MTCAKCKAGMVGTGAPICPSCRAEMILSGMESELRTIDRAYADRAGERMESMTWEELRSLSPRSPFEARTIRCEICDAGEPYNPMKARQGWPCERCKKHGLKCCMTMVIREMRPVTLCKLCCAELELSGDSIESAHEPMPGEAES